MLNPNRNKTFTSWGGYQFIGKLLDVIKLEPRLFLRMAVRIQSNIRGGRVRGAALTVEATATCREVNNREK